MARIALYYTRFSKSGMNSLVFSTVLGGTTGDDAITDMGSRFEPERLSDWWTSSSDFPITASSGFQSSFTPQEYCGSVTQGDSGTYLAVLIF